MARYVVSVRSPRSVDDAFAYMADLGNFAEWDPGVTAVDQVVGDSPASGSAYDVRVKGLIGNLTLTYVIGEFNEPRRVVARATSTLLTSVDEITVVADGTGSIVTYDAALTLNGLAGLVDPVLGLFFDRIGDKAAAGLLEALDGERVDAPVSAG